MGALSNSASAPSCRRSTSSTVWPALSIASASHCPADCKAARSSRSHEASGRVRPRALRNASTCKASCWVAAKAGCGVPGRSRQARRPALRSSVSAAVTSPELNAGAFLSQSSTASVEASHGMARSRPIRLAAARVVDSFQPVSSRIAMPRSASMAPTRRVRIRSCAISATGLRPWARCASTQAAARPASSSASIAACSDGRGNSAGALRSCGRHSAMEMERSPKCALSASVSGSA